MQIIVSGKHLEITDSIKTRIEDGLAGIFAEKTLKVSTIRVMVEYDKPRFTVDVMVNMKQHDFTASSEDFDVYKAIGAVIDKIHSQVEKYLTRVQDHDRDPLREVEQKASAEKEEE